MLPSLEVRMAALIIGADSASGGLWVILLVKHSTVELATDQHPLLNSTTAGDFLEGGVHLPVIPLCATISCPQHSPVAKDTAYYLQL